ncbi:hypothetical protein ANCCAN_10966 [Ancylostoma caninum]|uniref:Uncharacterized protein n=1 Tax=Ancylostoma caninum TaxID=29170 RepID=A0A368GJI2_ANCCA|nr:hypothetical protein ANCCAN_10966 [Ancylostoma caninum]
MVLLQLVLLVLLQRPCLGDVTAESSNGVVSVEATAAPELPFLADNDLVIGRASDKMILAELSAEEVNSNANTTSDESSAEKRYNCTIFQSDCLVFEQNRTAICDSVESILEVIPEISLEMSELSHHLCN